jgi:hypothetical protein
MTEIPKSFFFIHFFLFTVLCGLNFSLWMIVIQYDFNLRCKIISFFYNNNNNNNNDNNKKKKKKKKDKKKLLINK